VARQGLGVGCRQLLRMSLSVEGAGVHGWWCCRGIMRANVGLQCVLLSSVSMAWSRSCKCWWTCSGMAIG
jgi:hypothetical protein